MQVLVFCVTYSNFRLSFLTTFLDFNLPDDRKDRKPTKNKSTATSNKKKKKKGASKKKPNDQSLSATKKPDQPLTELYNYLSRQVMPVAGKFFSPPLEPNIYFFQYF